MIKLKKILSEILNNYQIEVNLFTDPTFNVTDILNQIRAVRKITIVSIITPDDFTQKPNVEYQKLKIKFVTRGEPKQDLEKIKSDILQSDLSKKDLRIPGVKSLKFIEGTLKRNSEAHDITVTGDVEVQDGGVLGDNDETGATSFGSLTISPEIKNY